MKPFITDVKVVITNDPSTLAMVTWLEDGQARETDELTLKEADELAFTIARRHLVAYSTMRGGHSVGVTIPNDESYVSPMQPVFTAANRKDERAFHAFSKSEANAYVSQEKTDDRDAEYGPCDWYVDGPNLLTFFDVPEHIRMTGRDAVMEWLNAE